MKDARLKALFLLCVSLLLLLPLFFTNLASNVASPLDNRMLASLPTSILEWSTEGENVLKDRIGFRDQMILGYHTGLMRLFGHMEHPFFLTGEEGHVYFGYKGYVNDLQALNYTQELVDESVAGLTRLRNRCKEQGVELLFVQFPDKKTVYPEYYDKNVHRQIGVPTLSEALEAALQKTDLHYVFAKEDLIAAKEFAPTYNKKFDPGHFNAYGAFVGLRSVAKSIQKIFPEYPLPELHEFEMGSKQQDLAQYINILDSDEVPTLRLKERNFEIIPGKGNEPWHFMSINHQAPVNKVLFVSGDSYLFDAACYEPTGSAIDYFAKAFHKVYFMGKNMSIEDMGRLGCDLYIYEMAERVVQNRVLTYFD